MERCPKCNCGAEFTNKLEYYAKNTGAIIGGVVVGGSITVINKDLGGTIGENIRKELTKDVHKHYKCTNSNCNYEWDEL